MIRLCSRVRRGIEGMIRNIRYPTRHVGDGGVVNV